MYHALQTQHGGVTRQQISLHDAAHRVACRSLATTFTIKLSSYKSPFYDVDYYYAGIRTIPATGLSPARQAALWAANRGTETQSSRGCLKSVLPKAKPDFKQDLLWEEEESFYISHLLQ
jgi:hypothetical protein